MNILIAGIGNIFLGDDGFGCEVAQRMTRRQLPQGVRVVDFGIRGLDLSYALVDYGFEAAILVDAARRGDVPGTLYLIEPETHADADSRGQHDLLIAPHEMDAGKVLRAVTAMVGHCERILLVGCEPESFGEDTDELGRIGLSAPVAAAVDKAIALIESLVVQMLRGGAAALGFERSVLATTSVVPRSIG